MEFNVRFSWSNIKEKPKLTFLFEKLELSYFRETEISYLEEYHKVMAPLAATLDYLQGQETTFFGYLLPSLISMKNKLLKLQNDNLKYGGEVILTAILKGLNERFKEYLNLENQDAIIAAALCPNLKLRWLGCLEMNTKLTVEHIKKMVVNAATEIEAKGAIRENNMPDEDDVGDSFFDFDELESGSYKKQLAAEVSTNQYQNINRTKSRIATKIELELMKHLDDRRRNLPMLNDFEILKKLLTFIGTS